MDLFGEALQFIQDNDAYQGKSFSLGQAAHMMAAFAKSKLEEKEELKKPNIQVINNDDGEEYQGCSRR